MAGEERCRCLPGDPLLHCRGDGVRRSDPEYSSHTVRSLALSLLLLFFLFRAGGRARAVVDISLVLAQLGMRNQQTLHSQGRLFKIVLVFGDPLQYYCSHRSEMSVQDRFRVMADSKQAIDKHDTAAVVSKKQKCAQSTDLNLAACV